MTHPIEAIIADGVGTILFNRPEARNAMSPAMVAGFVEITHAFERDPAVRCVVIRSTGDTFMAGGDVKSFHADAVTAQADYAAALEARIVHGQLAINRIRRMPKPVLVSVQGAAVGFALGIVAAADMAIASDDAMFLLAYRHIGFSSDGGISYALPRMVGERRALEIALLGERFSAQTALDWGIVNRVFPRAMLEAETMALAANLANGPTQAFADIKRLYRTSLDTGWDTQCAREAESVSALAATADHLEGLNAFVEKRKAHFTGT